MEAEWVSVPFYADSSEPHIMQVELQCGPSPSSSTTPTKPGTRMAYLSTNSHGGEQRSRGRLRPSPVRSPARSPARSPVCVYSARSRPASHSPASYSPVSTPRIVAHDNESDPIYEDDYSMSETASDHSSSSGQLSYRLTDSLASTSHSSARSCPAFTGLQNLSPQPPRGRSASKKREHFEEEPEVVPTETNVKRARKTPLSRSCPSFPELKRIDPLPYKTDHEYKLVEPRIVKELLDGNIAQDYQFYIVDCRFEYEYEGGHIRGAVNTPTPIGVLDRFFENGEDLQVNKKVIIIFHCEFSSKRAPETLTALRKIDSHRNSENWPNLYYPELYLLEGGYSAFWASYPQYCDPQGYVKMVDDGELCRSGHLLRRSSSHDLFEELGRVSDRPPEWGRRATSGRGSSGSPSRTSRSPRFMDRLKEAEDAASTENIPFNFEHARGEDPSLLSSVLLQNTTTNFANL